MIKVSKKYDINDCLTYNRNGRPAKYPWKTMEIGESFLSDGVSTTIIGVPNSKYAPKRFAARTTPEGVRVWRIK